MTSGRSLLAHVTVGQGDPVYVTGGGGGQSFCGSRDNQPAGSHIDAIPGGGWLRG